MKYRFLKEGEIIRKGDQCLTAKGWRSVCMSIGDEVHHFIAVAHGMRRLIRHPIIRRKAKKRCGMDKRSTPPMIDAANRPDNGRKEDR